MDRAVPPQLRGLLLNDLLRAAASTGFDAKDYGHDEAARWQRLEWVPAQQQVQLDEQRRDQVYPALVNDDEDAHAVLCTVIADIARKASS